MSGQPEISVLLPTHNAGEFLPLAVDSILHQHFDHFELVIVDDASTDGSTDFLKQIEDSRIRVITNQINLGVSASLNLGLEHCRGKLIARMDADDIAEPNRLLMQWQFLEAHPGVGIVGSARLLIDSAGKLVGEAPVMIGDLAIRWKCLLGNPLPHPTVMFRAELLPMHGLRYDTHFSSAQDYELWTRLLTVTRADNLPQLLLRYRQTPGSISQKRKAEQIANHDRIALQANRLLLPDFPLNAEQVRQLRGRFGGASVRDQAMDRTDPQWIGLLREMLEAFARMHQNEPGIKECVAAQHRWIDGMAIGGLSKRG